jgi:hypothetical protein
VHRTQVKKKKKQEYLYLFSFDMVPFISFHLSFYQLYLIQHERVVTFVQNVLLVHDVFLLVRGHNLRLGHALQRHHLCIDVDGVAVKKGEEGANPKRSNAKSFLLSSVVAKS